MINIEYEVNVKEESEYEISSPRQVYQETNGTLVNSYIKDGKLDDDSVKVDKGNFSEVDENSWSTSPSKLTKGRLGNFRVKNVVGIGPYGFYTSENGETVVKAPISRKGILPVISGVNIIDDGPAISYELLGDIIVYENVRITFSNENMSFEFIVKDREGKVSKPFEMGGEYVVTCVGYRNEIQDYSEPSNEMIVNIQARLAE